MREHSGTDGNSGSRDPTLKDNEGKGGTTPRGGDFTEGADTKVAADRDQPGGARSPGDRGRGEIASSDEASPVDINR